MEVKTERIIAYCLAAILLVVGVICYAAFAKKAPEQPIRIMFKNTGGNVLFDHKKHMSESGYGIECADCHHDLENKGEKPSACAECHTDDSTDAPKRSDAFHKQCKSCHEDGGGPVNCAECHAI
jgi:DnaJ-class molecular chaperone